MATASKSPDSSSNMNILIERNPPKSRLSELGIMSWPKWGCPPGKYALRFEARQTCYLLRGKVKVYPKGSSEYVEFGAGDLVTIPKGLSCTWDVTVSIDKHYNEALSLLAIFKEPEKKISRKIVRELAIFSKLWNFGLK